MTAIPQLFTVASYNIRHGHDADLQWDRLAVPITEVQADIVCLQEVDMGTRRIDGQNTVAGMKAATGLPHAVFAPAMRYNGGEYGLAVLTRFPILSHERIALPDVLGAEPRICVHLTVHMEGAEMHVFNTHLTHGRSAIRQRQCRALQAYLPTEAPFVLAGDLNTPHVREIEPLLIEGTAMVNDPARPLMTFRDPPAAIDHIVYATAWLTLHDRGTVDSPMSDHNLLWGRFSLDGHEL